MARKQILVDSDGNPTGNSWNSGDNDEESLDGFRALIEQDEGCPYCGYEGHLRSTRKGYKCPKCREIVIPTEP